MTNDPFFERLRNDAAALQYEPDDFALARIRARIASRIAARPTVAQLLAKWFRPLAATLTAIAIAAAIGIASIDTNDTSLGGDEGVQIVMAGDAYSVGR